MKQLALVLSILAISFTGSLSFAQTEDLDLPQVEGAEPEESAAAEASTDEYDEAEAEQAAPAQTLFERIGEKKGIARIITSLVRNIEKDSSLRPYFAVSFNNPKRLKVLKIRMALHMCKMVGGPCKYKGRDMGAAHRNMGIKKKHFSKYSKALKKALKENSIPKSESKEVLALFSPMAGSVMQ